MTPQDLQQKALKILAESLDNESLSPEQKAEIALKILDVTSSSPDNDSFTSNQSLEKDSHPLPVSELYYLSELWQQWLIENKLRGVADQNLVDILKKQGIDEQTAHKIIFALPQEITFSFLSPQWRSLQQSQLIIEQYRSQDQLYPNEIQWRSHLTETEFFQDYFLPHRPVILTDLGNTEPWHTVPSLIEHFGDRPVIPKAFPNLNATQPIEQKPTITEIHTLRDYCFQSDINAYLDFDLATWGEDIVQSFWYHYPALSHYLDFLFAKEDCTYLWLQSTYSALPLQAKLDNILVVQIQGESQWYLCPPWHTQSLYSDENWVSYIDVQSPNLDRFPLLQDVPWQTITLHANEALFIPALWWQQCRATQLSIQAISLNFKI